MKLEIELKQANEDYCLFSCLEAGEMFQFDDPKLNHKSVGIRINDHNRLRSWRGWVNIAKDSEFMIMFPSQDLRVKRLKGKAVITVEG